MSHNRYHGDIFRHCSIEWFNRPMKLPIVLAVGFLSFPLLYSCRPWTDPDVLRIRDVPYVRRPPLKRPNRKRKEIVEVDEKAIGASDDTSLVRPYTRYRRLLSRVRSNWFRLIGDEAQANNEEARIRADTQRCQSLINQTDEEYIRGNGRRVRFDPALDQFEAVKNDDCQALLSALRETKDVDLQNGWGETALHIAVNEGSRRSIVMLSRHLGADVNAFDHDGWTPLHLAAVHNDVETCELLVATGANVLHRTCEAQYKPIDVCQRGCDQFTACVDFLSKVEEMLRSGNSPFLCLNREIRNRDGDVLANRGQKIELMRSTEDKRGSRTSHLTREALMLSRRMAAESELPVYEKWAVKLVDSGKIIRVPCVAISMAELREPRVDLNRTDQDNTSQTPKNESAKNREVSSEFVTKSKTHNQSDGNNTLLNTETSSSFCDHESEELRIKSRKKKKCLRGNVKEKGKSVFD
ncbi:hypothetical protein ACOME3_000102 [Neoechinorhynchus agilis]